MSNLKSMLQEALVEARKTQSQTGQSQLTNEIAVLLNRFFAGPETKKFVSEVTKKTPAATGSSSFKKWQPGKTISQPSSSPQKSVAEIEEVVDTSDNSEVTEADLLEWSKLDASALKQKLSLEDMQAVADKFGFTIMKTTHNSFARELVKKIKEAITATDVADNS